MEAIEVGVREFREKLSDYSLPSDRPVAVTRHGATVGYFIPTQAERGLERLRTLRAAGAAVDAMLARAQVSEADVEAIAHEFALARKAGRGR
jgi:antitoxin (DNA-binding transcriptional repressor) of toxin-antitoxin stability system